MKKLSFVLLNMLLATAFLFTSCSKDDEETTPATISLSADGDVSGTFPETTGDAAIELKNFSSDEIQVEAGNILSLAVEVTKNSNRAKKIRIFASDCKNSLGNEYDLSDQPKGGKNGIDLRSTDDAQLRNVNYTVPTGFETIYLTIEIDEAGDNVSYKQLTLNVSGSGIIDTWSNVLLGGNSNANPSRMASGTGQSYLQCDAAENIDYIDITYAVSPNTPDYLSYLCSNPARFTTPIDIVNKDIAGCDDSGEMKSQDGGKASYFKAAGEDIDFDAATNTEIDGLTISSNDNQYAEIKAEGDVFEFLSADGRKGLIKVTKVNGDDTYGSSPLTLVTLINPFLPSADKNSKTSPSALISAY
jgi:hypothetical protein